MQRSRLIQIKYWQQFLLNMLKVQFRERLGVSRVYYLQFSTRGFTSLDLVCGFAFVRNLGHQKNTRNHRVLI
jgi:hypothetical protein